MTPPLILTLTLDPDSQAFFDRERRRWFPPARNVIPAHVTLFHHLPGGNLARILDDLAAVCEHEPPARFATDGVRFLGRGVAYSLHAAAAAALRGRLAALWHDGLTPQDRQPWRAHITIQNKADPAEARALHENLVRDFTPRSGTATGVTLWRYLGGPWSLESSIAFAAPQGEADA